MSGLTNTVNVRYLRSIITGLLGGEAHVESLGFGPIQTCALLTNGALEPLDVLRITGYRATETQTNIFQHTFQDVTEDPVWLEAFMAAQSLGDTCRTCRYGRSCGGGFLPHRFSTEKRFDIPSVYCKDLQDIFDHIADRLAPNIGVETPTGVAPLNEVLR